MAHLPHVVSVGGLIALHPTQCAASRFWCSRSVAPLLQKTRRWRRCAMWPQEEISIMIKIGSSLIVLTLAGA
jgi:hypothetical protein